MKSEVTTIAAMLEDDVEYVIPQFQRAYAWKKEDQWSPLWDDITNTAQAITAAGGFAEVPPHFMGPLVIQERNAHPDGRPPGFIVVDGQQRITTMLVLLKAVGDAAKELDMPDFAEQFFAHIWNEIGHGVKTPKVRHANSRDRRALLEVLHDLADTDADSRIADCYAFFNDAAVCYLSKREGRQERCQSLLDALERKMQTAALTLDPEEKPNAVFETLNARAEPLKQSELVKNTVMYEGGVVEDEEGAAELWSQDFEDEYWRKEYANGETTLDFFLSDWLTARLERRITPNRVSPEFRDYLRRMKTDGRNIRYVASRLNYAAKIYRAVEADEFRDTLPSSQRLLDMGIRAAMPIILWLWDDDNNVTRRERQNVLRIVESYAVRRILAGLSIGTNLIGSLIALLPQLRAASDQSESHSRVVRDAFNNVTIDSARCPKDREIIERLRQQPHGMSNARRDVVLIALENILRRRNELPPLDFRVYPAQVMPGSEASLSGAWPLTGRATESRRQRRRERVEFLGNWTLTKTRMSSRQREAPWAEKVEILTNHREVEMTRYLLEEYGTQWTEDAIVDRTEMMAELAMETWPHPAG